MSYNDKCNSDSTCTKKCADSGNKLIDLLETAKSVYERLDKDICQYVIDLGKLQNCFQAFDLDDEVMLESLIKRYNLLSEYMYVSIINHLSISACVEGVGSVIIKPVVGKSYTTTLKYQNVQKKCTGCDECMSGILASRASNKYYGCGDVLRVQFSKNVATYDNMSVYRNYNGPNVVGYTIKIGELQYTLRNGNSLPIKRNECITQKNIIDLFEMIDSEIKNLGDIQRMIRNNINFIMKYIKKFRKAC